MKKIKLVIAVLLAIFYVNANSQQFLVKGTAVKLNPLNYRLTRDTNDQAGMITSLYPLDLTTNFTLNFDINLGLNDGGADGIAFMLSRNCNPTLSQGQGLGVQGTTNSIVVDFDTYDNSFILDDLSDDHTGIYSDGNFSSSTNLIDVTAAPVCMFPNCSNAENGQWISIKIQWTYISATSQSLKVFINDSLRATSTQNHIQNRFLNQSKVFYSIAASTGGSTNEQSVRFPSSNTNVTYCSGESITLTAPGLGTNYSWTGGITSTTNTATFMATTSQTVTCNYTDFCNKPQSISFEINVNNITNPSSTQFLCFNGDPSPFSVATSALASAGIRYVYFNTIQTGGNMYTGGTFLADVNATSGQAVYDAPALGLLGSLPNSIGTYYVYAIANPVPLNATCRPFQEIIINVDKYVNSVENKKICIGDTYKGRSTAGIYKDTISNPSGCDTINTLNLSVISVASSFKDSFYCNSFTFKNKTYTRDTNLIDTFKATFGCDSLYLTFRFKKIIPIRIKNDTIRFCDTISVAGFLYNRDTLLPQSITKTVAPFCDSIIYDIKLIRYPGFSNASLTASPDTDVDPGTSVTLTASGGESYYWPTGGNTSSQATYTIISNSIFQVKITDSNKCDTILSIRVNITPTVTFPIIFSPNEDGANETIGPNISGNLTVNFYKIYNRWGQLVFDGRGSDLNWDGKYKGEKQPQGSYVFSCEYILNGKVNTKMGGITLIR
jgi:gliding motility-associated-like protein